MEKQSVPDKVNIPALVLGVIADVERIVTRRDEHVGEHGRNVLLIAIAKCDEYAAQDLMLPQPNGTQVARVIDQLERASAQANGLGRRLFRAAEENRRR